MTNRDDDPSKPDGERAKGDETVDSNTASLLSRALGNTDRLIPETPDEVARAEAEQSAAEKQEGAFDESENDALPARLRSFGGFDGAQHESHARVTGPPSEQSSRRAKENESTASNVTSLGERRRSHALRYALGFALGAAAATFVWLQQQPESEVAPPPIAGVPTELEPTPQPPKGKAKIDLSTVCVGCCGGSQCKSAPEAMRTCPSGRSCVECEAADERNVFKLRLSAVGLTDEGKSWLKENEMDLGALSVCANVQGRKLGCRSAAGDAQDLVKWWSLPVTTTTPQLIGGLGVELKQSPEGMSFASFDSAVTVSADTLCRGVAARLALPDGRIIGKVSAFLDDTHFVELARASSVPELLRHKEQYEVSGGVADVYEANAGEAERFVLAIGPLGRGAAHRTRWQLLEQEREATITFGDDYVGSPRPR